MKQEGGISHNRVKMGLVHIKEVVEKAIRHYKLSEERVVLLELWEKETGQYSGSTRLKKFSKGKLLVEVDNHVLLNELMIRRNEIMKRLNSVLTKEKIKEIMFKTTKDY